MKKLHNYCRECDNFPGAGKKCTTEKRQLNVSLNKACDKFVTPDELEFIRPDEPLFPETNHIEFLKKEPNGRVKVIDRVPKRSSEGINLVMEVIELKEAEGKECPYSFRYV